jgi:hypothetical protein
VAGALPGGGALEDVVAERGRGAREAVVGEERHDLVQPRRRHAPAGRARSVGVGGGLAQARGRRRGEVSGCVAIGRGGLGSEAREDRGVFE